MIIRDITYYLQEKLSEEEAIELWIQLAKNDRDYKLFEICLSLRQIFTKRKAA